MITDARAEGAFGFRMNPSNFWSKVSAMEEDCCWEWNGSRQKRGYGMMGWGGKTTLAHRVSWHISRGMMPESSGKICHSCDNPRCVNPDHLFFGSQKMNMVDAALKGRLGRHGIGKPTWGAKLTHCLKGHALSGDNLRISAGKRVCRTCARERQRTYR